jgi:hypothetical protein
MLEGGCAVSGAQKVVVLLGLIVFVLMGSFPPWVCQYPAGWQPSGYAFVGTGPSNPNLQDFREGQLIIRWGSARLDLARLVTQWVALAVVVGTILVLLYRGRRLPSPAP